MIETSTLTSLAMLKVDMDVRNRDYLDYLVPFIIHVLRKNSPVFVNDRQTSEWIRETFGLVIPSSAVQLVLKRLAKSKFLKRSEGIYTISSELPDQNIESKQSEARRHINNVINEMILFSKNQYSVILTEKEANDLTLAFLSQFSVECLRTYIRGTALPEVKIAKKSDWYIINSFVKHIHLNNHTLFDSIDHSFKSTHAHKCIDMP